jgi:hypothetical protein
LARGGAHCHPTPHRRPSHRPRHQPMRPDTNRWPRTPNHGTEHGTRNSRALRCTSGRRASGPTGAVPGDRRSLSGSTYRQALSPAPGSATRVAVNFTRWRHSHVSRTQTPPPLVAWASSPRKDHLPSENRPHDGQDARRTMGCGVGGSGGVRVRGGGSDSSQLRYPKRSRSPDTVPGHGHGPERC